MQCLLCLGHTLATNWHFPANFTDVDLPDVKITPSLNSVSENNDTITVRYDKMLYCLGLKILCSLV